MAIVLRTDYIEQALPQREIFAVQDEVRRCHEALCTKSGKGGEFTGWLTLPLDYDKNEWQRIKAAAAKIQQEAQVLLVIGIGGRISAPGPPSNFAFSVLQQQKKEDP
jgi:glucose-6-phosphate isomerase